jgi:hypothetical protein
MGPYFWHYLFAIFRNYIFVCRSLRIKHYVYYYVILSLTRACIIINNFSLCKGNETPEDGK